MEYAEWAPYYRRIQADFGFVFSEEERSAAALVAALPPESLGDPAPELRARLAHRTAIIVGLAPGAGPPPLWRWHQPPPPPLVLAADGATARCLEAGIIPEIIVTDLDGPVPSEVAANARGALAVVHAHGDNRAAVERWVPELSGRVIGSWAGPPRPGLIDVGGFTDGDRAAFLADHFGAERIVLWGFDFERVDASEGGEMERKRAKLRWARALLELLASRAPGRLWWWAPDGSVAPFETQGGGHATQ